MESSEWERIRRKKRYMRKRRRQIQRRLVLTMVLSVFLISVLAGKLLSGVYSALATGGGGKQANNNADMAIVSTETASEKETELELDELSDEEKEEYIQEHSWLYTEDLLELLEKNKETVNYVYEYPKLCGQEPEINLSEEAEYETVPLLLQWDARWCYEPYGDGLIGYTGCAPTCISMVALYLTGVADYTPLYIAEYAETNGYYVSGVGTDWSLLNTGCSAFGIQTKELPLDEDYMKKELNAGHPLICSVGAGDFTDNGHFLVLTGYTDEGFSLNDPNSVKNSNRVWSYEELAGQIRKIWMCLQN